MEIILCHTTANMESFWNILITIDIYLPYFLYIWYNSFFLLLLRITNTIVKVHQMTDSNML